MADKRGTCYSCGNELLEVYPAMNGTPGFYVCDTPGCPDNYAENNARDEGCYDAPPALGATITEKKFIEKTGSRPQHDDLKRVNCEHAGEVGHTACGWCTEHDLPRFMCGCRVMAEALR